MSPLTPTLRRVRRSITDTASPATFAALGRYSHRILDAFALSVYRAVWASNSRRQTSPERTKAVERSLPTVWRPTCPSKKTGRMPGEEDPASGARLILTRAAVSCPVTACERRHVRPLHEALVSVASRRILPAIPDASADWLPSGRFWL